MQQNQKWVALVAPALIAVVVFASPVRGDDAAVAKQVLDLAGTRIGLCLHLGCGRDASPALTAELAASGNLLVHGIALDDASLDRARKAIDAKGLSGRAMIEKVDVKPLPYLSDLANLVVIEDFDALAKHGLTMEEVMRVCAPGGAVLTVKGGKWTKVVKQRPADMDEWTHPNHGADGNLVSVDKAVQFPIGFRWIDGLPININRWAACRAWVVAGGRVFALTVNEPENLGPPIRKEHYLSAHDAWNGMPLWKINCETSDDGAYLTWMNVGPLASDGARVFAVQKDKAIGVDAATGKILTTFPTKYQPVKLALADGVLVTSCWERKVMSKAKFDRESLWATWAPADDVGTVEAYDAKTGAPKWSKPFPSHTVLISDGVVYLLASKGNPVTEREVIACDLATGKERWRVPHTTFGEYPDLRLCVAGKGFAVVAKQGTLDGLGAPKKAPDEKPKEKSLFILSAANGKTLWQMKPAASIWTPIVEGLLWYGSKKYDPLTGKEQGNIGWGIGDQFCTPQAIIGNFLTRTRGGQYIELPHPGSAGGSKDLRYGGARGACMEGMVAANGMFYTAQNNCRCSPGQVYGFVAVGPCGEWPAAADFEKARPVEKGPAFGKAEAAQNAADDWPTYRHDAERSAASPVAPAAPLKPLWKTPVAKPAEGPATEGWKSRLVSCVTAPVSAGGMVFVAAGDAGQVVALNAATGKQAWSTTLGGRVDSPPTIWRGLCLVGCHDGWVYALSAKDGALAWRTRVAPVERRMVAYGEVESVWPAVGTVLVNDGVAYACAGRTSESDGGIAVVALNAGSGAQVWAKAIAPGASRMNDMLALQDGAVGWHHFRLDAKTGAAMKPAPEPKDASHGGMLDGSWTMVGKRRSGNAFEVGRIQADLMAWNDALIVTNKAAYSRKEDAAKDQPPPKVEPSLWTVQAGGQVEAVALAGSAVIYAGRVAARDGGKPTGFLWVVWAADGKKLAEFALDAPPTFDGLAVAGGKVFVSLQNGSVVCFGKEN